MDWGTQGTLKIGLRRTFSAKPGRGGGRGGRGRGTPDPIWAETPKLSAVGEKTHFLS